MNRKTIVEIVVVLYVILFLYTGISKLMEYNVFKQQIAESPVLAPFANLISFSLPLAEFLVSILLIIPKWRLKGLYSGLILMLSFTVYIICILSLSKQIPCSCGGVLSEMSWGQHIIFNGAFIGLAILGIVNEKNLKREHKIEWASVIDHALDVQTNKV